VTEAPRFSRKTKLAEILREIGQRRNVYPRLVSKGEMRKAEADMLIEIMLDIARDYERAINRPKEEH
jgi:hypothetical protein